MYRQPSHWNQQLRLNDLQLGLQPVGTARLLETTRNPITSPTGVRPRIAAGDGGDVNEFARRCLIDSRPREPTKQRLSRSTGKWDSALRLHLSWSLPYEHHTRVGSLRGDRTDASAKLAALTNAEGKAMSREGADSSGGVHTWLYPDATEAQSTCASPK